MPVEQLGRQIDRRPLLGLRGQFQSTGYVRGQIDGQRYLIGGAWFWHGRCAPTLKCSPLPLVFPTWWLNVPIVAIFPAPIAAAVDSN
jgi:hypothetical protein